MHDPFASPFSVFLETALGQSEVSCILAHHDQELAWYERGLVDAGFVCTSSPERVTRALAQGARVAYVVRHADDAKTAYDLACQYPTGQVELFDQASHAPLACSPLYAQTACAVLVTKAQLFDMCEAGMEMLSKVGMTHQS